MILSTLTEKQIKSILRTKQAITGSIEGSSLEMSGTLFKCCRYSFSLLNNDRVGNGRGQG